MRYFTIALFALTSLAASRSVNYGRGLANRALPTYARGYVIFTERPNTVEVWGPDGQQLFRTQVMTPAGAQVSGVTHDGAGTTAVAVAYRTPEGMAGGVALLDRTGKQIRFIETGLYMPANLSFDQQHALWAFGWQRDTVRNDSESDTDYLMFRKYSSEGQPLGAYLKRSLFPVPGLAPGSAQGGLWKLHAASDRIGALATVGPTSAALEWIELGLDGQLIGHWTLGRGAQDGGWAYLEGIGLCDQSFAGGNPVIRRFDTASNGWRPLVELPDTHLGNLLGAQEGQAVFGKDQGTLNLTYLPLPAASAH